MEAKLATLRVVPKNKGTKANPPNLLEGHQNTNKPKLFVTMFGPSGESSPLRAELCFLVARYPSQCFGWFVIPLSFGVYIDKWKQSQNLQNGKWTNKQNSTLKRDGVAWGTKHGPQTFGFLIFCYHAQCLGGLALVTLFFWYHSQGFGLLVHFPLLFYMDGWQRSQTISF